MTNNRSKEVAIAYFYCIATTIIFCFHFFAAKDVLKSVDPLMLGAARGIIGGTVLLAIYSKSVISHINWKTIKHLVIIAGLGFFLNQICFMYGLMKSTPTNASIIINTIPIATTLMAILFALERFSWRKSVGILLGFGSIVALTICGGEAAFSSSATGDLLIFLNVLSLCMAMTIAKKILSDDFPPALLATGLLLIGGVLLLIFSYKHIPSFIQYTSTSPSQFGIMFFEVVISTSITYLLMFKSLQILNPSQNTIFIYFQPPITALLEYIFYKEIPSLMLIPVCVAVMIAGYLVLAKNKEHKAHHRH